MSEKEQLLSEEETTSANEEDFEDIPETFYCKYCKFETQNVDNLDEHIISHEEAILEDTELEEDIYSKDAKETSSGKRIPRCPFDNQAQNEKEQDLPAFYKQYADKKDKMVFVCPYCGYQTMKYFDMHSHLKERIESVDYVCAECPYRSKRKYDITRHLLVHCDGVEPVFKCSNCPFKTTRKHSLIRHTRHQCHSHLGVTDDRNQFVFNCTECGYTCKRLNALHSHVVLHCDRTVEDMMKCTKCEYSSTERSHFAKHVLSHCKIKEVNLSALP